MSTISRATDIATKSFPYTAGAFYGSHSGLALGVGLLYEGVRYPLYNNSSRTFDTVEGAAMVLTHECDVDQDNDRHFNEYLLICPIIPFADFVEECVESASEDSLFNILPELVRDNIFRAFFLPPHNVKGLDSGGITMLNQISSTHIEEFREGRAKPVCALSEYALRIFDKKLENHLLRPKSESLPRTK